MELVLTFIGLALVGVVVGIACGLLGIGGGTVMVPVLRLAFGLNAYAAAATSLFTMIFSSISGAASHLQQKTCIPKLGIALGVGGCITSALGVYLGSLSPSWAIMLVAAVIIIYSAVNMLRKALGKKKPAKDVGRQDEYELTPKRLAGGFGIGLFAGLCAGYVGVGGGFIMVPLMTAWLGVPMRKASGTSTIAIIILSIPGIIEQALFGNIDYMVGIAMAVGSIPGAAIGARFVKRIPEKQLRLIFAAFLAFAGVMLVVKELVEFA